jgi:hypothetical protein
VGPKGPFSQHRDRVGMNVRMVYVNVVEKS